MNSGQHKKRRGIHGSCVAERHCWDDEQRDYESFGLQDRAGHIFELLQCLKARLAITAILVHTVEHIAQYDIVLM